MKPTPWPVVVIASALLPSAGQPAATAEEAGPAQQRLVPAPRTTEFPVTWTSPPPEDCPFELSEQFVGIVFTGPHKVYTRADTWYPSWASDGNLYAPWTDGSVGEMRSHSGPKSWTTGHAKIVGDKAE